jgi:hypothetical protein
MEPSEIVIITLCFCLVLSLGGHFYQLSLFKHLAQMTAGDLANIPALSTSETKAAGFFDTPRARMEIARYLNSQNYSVGAELGVR